MKSLHQIVALLLSSITLLQVAPCDAAPVNLNVKSGLLSRWMGKPSSPKSNANGYRDSASTQQSSSTTTASKGKVSLDLSGKYHCLVAGPTSQDDMEGAPIPLFQIGKVQKGWSPPSLTCSIKYNFSQAWYGATRILGNLAWSYRSARDDLDRRIASSPLTINLQAEAGLSEQDDDYALQVGVALRSMDLNPPSLSLRFQTECTQVSVVAPIHRRLQVVWRSIIPTPQEGLHRGSYSFFSQSLPDKQQDWWIPTLKVNTAGRLAADNHVGFRVNDKRNVGIRLLLSRQLGWSAFGAGEAMNDHLGTVMRLEVMGTENGKSFSTLALHSVLERPLDSTLFTFSHEQVHTN